MPRYAKSLPPGPVTETPPLVHRVPEAAARLRVSRSGLYLLIKSGEIKVIKVGQLTLIPETELQAFVTRNTGGRAVR